MQESNEEKKTKRIKLKLIEKIVLHFYDGNEKNIMIIDVLTVLKDFPLYKVILQNFIDFD
ncbi:MAG: hypothetical protein JSW62_04730 [Thermoplasmatales archaeon]|nr:MAG: hypothetical protein JSW62_04730 [Thermoplasmatales archaeon]